MAFHSKIIRSKPYIVTLSLLAVFFIGFADYINGTEINLAIFYLLPISFVLGLPVVKRGC